METNETTNLLKEKGPQHKVYKTRWLILLWYSLLNACNAMLWISFAPIADIVQQFFHTTQFWVNMLSVVFMIAYIPFLFVASWALDVKGLRFGLVVGSVLTLVGAWVRVAGRYSFIWVVVGQTLAAIGQPFILTAGPKLAVNWFPDDQRTTATTIASLINPLGTAIGFVIPSVLAKSPSDIPRFLLYNGFIASGLCIPTILFLRSKPPTPPSYGADAERDESYLRSLKQILSDFNFWLLLLQFGISIGIFNAMATIVNEMIAPFGYNDNDSSYIGATFVISGIIGAGIFGAFVDKTRAYKVFLILGYLGAIGGILMLAFMVAPNRILYLCIAVGILGFFATPVIPLTFELACEICFPVGEAAPTGLLMGIGQAAGIIIIVGVDPLLTSKDSIRWMLFGGAGLFGVGLLIIFCFTGTLKRLAHEHMKHIERTQLPQDF